MGCIRKNNEGKDYLKPTSKKDSIIERKALESEAFDRLREKAKNLDKERKSNQESIDGQLKGLDKISVWKKASFEQRFDICSQFAIIVNKEPGAKVTAMDIHNCIEEATRGLDQVNEITISLMARLCVNKIREV